MKWIHMIHRYTHRNMSLLFNCNYLGQCERVHLSSAVGLFHLFLTAEI